MAGLNWEKAKQRDKLRRYEPYEPESPVLGSKKSTKRKKPKKKDRNINHVLMVSKYPSYCRHCKEDMEAGTKVWWSSKDKYVVHFGCFEDFIRGTKRKG